MASPEKLEPRIGELRKLLRTNLSIAEIAERLGVGESSIKKFCRSRGLCSPMERRRMIERQRMVAAP